LAWRSDIDGPVGTGVAFASDALSEGIHQITLTAIDSEGATGTAGVTITISDLEPGQCLGNEDPDTGCTTCLSGWTDVDGDHCSTLVRYVDIDNHGHTDLDGLTWSTAIFAVQDGIDTCQTALQDNPDESHCEVWVAEGIYYIYQTARHNSVQLRTGVYIFGGFSGTETHRDQRNWTEHMTILDGHKNADSSERVEHVVLCEDEGLVDGFIITRGSSSCDDVYNGGGGMYNAAGSRPVVRNTIFRNNTVECGTGGGMYNDENSISTIINCAFDNNESEAGGGLFVAGGAVLRAESCVFQDNLSWSGGGAVMTTGTQTVFIQCQFISNTGNTGGAIYSSKQTELEVDGCLFSNNSYNAELGMPYGGGALRLLQTHATIKNSGFVNNKYIYPIDSQPYGAAVNSTGPEGTLDIVNSYFYGNLTDFQNEATIPGSAINSIDNQRLTLINCTIFQNQFINENPDNAIGGGLYSGNTPVTITNCIIRDNIPGQVSSSNPDATIITYSNVAGISIYPVQNHNIDQPVYFAGDADLHLLPHDPNDESVRNPCIDAGNGDVAPGTDFDGNPRVDDPQTANTGSGAPGYADMGAFEYQP
jgi:predicted outer membrane repeat protein